MKNDRILVIILAVITASAAVWALKLNNTCEALKSKKIELEDRLSQALKDKDFLKAQLDDLEKKFEAQAQDNGNLTQQIEESRNTIDGLQREILRLTETNKEIENRLNSLLENKTGEEKSVQATAVNLPNEILPNTPQAQQESNSPVAEGVVPLVQ